MDPHTDLFVALEQFQKASTPLVAVLGDRDRTWFDDHDILKELLKLLVEARDDTILVHAGKYPFDMLVERFAPELGIPSGIIGPKQWELRLSDYERPLEVLDEVSLLLVFASETKTPENVDPLVPIAKELGIPVLVVWRYSSPEFWT